MLLHTTAIANAHGGVMLLSLQAILVLKQLSEMFEGVITQTLRGGRAAGARRDVVFAERHEKVRHPNASSKCKCKCKCKCKSKCKCKCNCESKCKMRMQMQMQMQMRIPNAKCELQMQVQCSLLQPNAQLPDDAQTIYGIPSVYGGHQCQNNIYVQERQEVCPSFIFFL